MSAWTGRRRFAARLVRVLPLQERIVRQHRLALTVLLGAVVAAEMLRGKKGFFRFDELVMS